MMVAAGGGGGWWWRLVVVAVGGSGRWWRLVVAASGTGGRRHPAALSSRRASIAAMDFAEQRRDYFGALEWASGLMRATALAQMNAPTPCEEFTVRDLMGHLIGTAQRSAGTAQGTPTRHIPHVVTGMADEDLAAAYESITGDMRKLWEPISGDDRVAAPWGACTALEALRGFTVETVTHGWDLAVATGQPREAPGQIADRCLLFASEIIPERLRGVMYGQPVAASRGDSPTTRLAHSLGRR